MKVGEWGGDVRERDGGTGEGGGREEVRKGSRG